MEKCCECLNTATWCYLPSDSKDMYFCEKHVPRGCSCQEDLNEPCCEYINNIKGWQIGD